MSRSAENRLVVDDPRPNKPGIGGFGRVAGVTSTGYQRTSHQEKPASPEMHSHPPRLRIAAVRPL